MNVGFAELFGILRMLNLVNLCIKFTFLWFPLYNQKTPKLSSTIHSIIFWFLSQLSTNIPFRISNLSKLQVFECLFLQSPNL
ncbi:unnamed protein product [Paramecium primaurelia]|uniref:Uncharacterized protein n=1 Tax=Paramecium primaurelia TaxID=5886 RepID=A0A8S1PC94_PARPR|nr:unnamed protein product [Paramecium primaurelia]